MEYCFHFVRNTSKTWLQGDYETRIRFQRLLFEKNLEFDGSRFGKPDLSPIYKLNQEYGGEKSHLVARNGTGFELWIG